MIRHRPFGRGHAYRIEPDQRVPTRPIAGEVVELRATTNPSIEMVEVELDTLEGVVILPATPASAAGSEPAVGGVAAAPGQLDALAAPADDGHLASAAANGERRGGRKGWAVRVGPLEAGGRLRYRFVGRGTAGTPPRRTRWFEVGVSSWLGDAGTLTVNVRGDPAIGDRVDASSVRWLSGPDGVSGVRLALRLSDGERLMGFGERFDALDQRGRQLDAVVFEQYRDQGNRSYLPIPFAIVVGGDGATWGFHVATTRRTSFDIGATDGDRLRIDVRLDPEGPPQLTVQLFSGTPSEILDAFFDATGRPTLPPDWTLRPWMSGNEWNTQARVEAEVARSRDLGIPVGVVVIEAWSDEATFVAFRDAAYEPHLDGAPHRLTDFTFPPGGAWPDPKAMIDRLHDAGIRVLLWQIPLLKARPAGNAQARHDAATMVARGYGVREADGRPYRNRGWWFPRSQLIDFTSPDARRWWLEKRRYLVEEVGVDGFKTDGGEHAWGDELRYGDGSRGGETNNRYPVLYAAAYHELLRSAGADPVTFSRAGFSGAQTAPLHWAGDERSTWAAFRASITAGLSAGVSGIFFWGWDLGGFSGPTPDAELYLRAAAMAAFCPVMQYHSEYNFHRVPSNDRTPWNIAERTGDERVVPAFRALARLRERLVLYLAEQARGSVARSRPLMRALPFEWPEDGRVWDYPFEYLLGDDLLVAPIVEPGVEAVTVYLPAGEWTDAWSGEALVGPIEVVRQVPLGGIAVFRRTPSSERLNGVFETP